MAITFAWQPFWNVSGQGTYLLWPMLLYVQMASWSGNQVLHKTKLRIIQLSWVELRLGLILWFYPRYLWTIFLLSKYKDDWKSPSGIVFAFLQIRLEFGWASADSYTSAGVRLIPKLGLAEAVAWNRNIRPPVKRKGYFEKILRLRLRFLISPLRLLFRDTRYLTNLGYQAPH